MLLTTYRRLKHYRANEDRIILKDGLLFQKNYRETGSVKYYHIFIPNQLVSEALRKLHGEFGKYPGFTKTITAYTGKYYFTNMAQRIKEWVMSYERCIRESRINRNLTRPLLENAIENNTALEDGLPIDLVPEVPPSGGCEIIVTAIDLNSLYLFAYLTSNKDAKTTAKNI